MNILVVFINYIKECFILGGTTFAVLGLLGLIGVWPVLAYFPRSEALRWPMYAPTFGLALLTVVGLPLVLLGFPVSRWALMFASLCGGLGIAALIHRLRSTQGRRLLFSYIRIRSWNIVIILLVPILLSTYLVAGLHGGHVRDVWGSGDFGAYWIVPEYLQNNGASLYSYMHQSQYYASDIVDHLTKHARLGCMVSFSFLGSMLSPGNIHYIIIPFIVAAIILMLGLAQRWLEHERLNSYWLLLPLLCYPFLYFLLYFTYVSQAAGVLLFIASLLLLSGAQDAVPGGDKSFRMILSGILAGASVLHYPGMLLAIVICMAFLISTEISAGTFIYSVLWSAITLLVCSYYLPQVIHELTQVYSSAQLPGWDWKSMSGSLEFLGFRSVLGYDLPAPRSTSLKLLDYVVSSGMIVLLLFGVWISRLRLAALTVVTTSGLLATAAYVKNMQNIPHATHAFVKAISIFAIFLLLIIMVSLGRLLTQKNITQKVILFSMTIILVIGQLISVDYGSRQLPWYTDDLIALSRRQLEKGYFIRFDPDMHWEMSAPIVRDSRRLLHEGSLVKEPFVIVMQKKRLLLYNKPKIVDSEGSCVAVRYEAIR